ncbi:MAG TPA: hypothetical protein VHO25_18215 [Polyangiaceae bacterium]|nr:hypothetical protein [Polyangiaceae bacterium]
MSHRAGRLASHLWLPLIGVAIAIACGNDSNGGVPKCTPGTTQTCACLGGGSGVQSCMPNGAFGQCVCGGNVDGGPSATDDASSGGTSNGAAGNSSTAGSADMDASAGANGNAGAGGSSGSTGVDGSSPAVFSKAEAAQICLAFAACMPMEFDGNFFGNANDCVNDAGIFSYRSPGSFAAPYFMTRTTPRMKEVYQCMLDALPDCTAIIACTSPDAPTSATACSTFDSLTDGGSCDGTKRSGCSVDGWSYTVDCARFDQVCVGDGTSAAACDFPDCTPSDPLDEVVCDDTNVVSCGVSGDLYVEENCALNQLECGTFAYDGGTSIGCIGGQSCDPDAVEDVCDGNVKVECDRLADDVSGQMVRYDCASDPFEGRCDVDDCVTTGTECDPEIAPTCSGDSVQLCEAGFIASYDCTELGFASCSMGLCVP